MKYFLKALIKSKEGKQNTYYFVPDIVARGIEVDEGYVISASVKDGVYDFSIIKDKKYIGGFNHVIKPKQKIEIADNDYALLFSLTSSVSVVKKYLKSKSDTTVREMEEFYLYIGKEKKIKKKRTYGSWNPTSGMDPDLRDEYEWKGSI